MSPNWIKIQVYNQALHAEIVKQMLLENHIPAVLLNKQDSSYLFGVIELYVETENQLEAIALMDSFTQEDFTDED